MEQISILLDNLTAEEREQLMKLVKKGNKKSKVWKPENNKPYWTVNSYGRTSVVYNWTDDPDDNGSWLIGNCFPTEEAAEEEVTRRKTLVKWKQMAIEAGEDDNPWDCKHKHWAVGYDCGTRSFYYYDYSDVRYARVFFPSKESLEAAIDELGEENVKRYILGVTE